MRSILSLKTPADIRPGEVVTFWEKLTEKVPHGCYAVYRSPNRELRAWVDPDTGAVATLWDANTGYVYQVDAKTMYKLVSKLGGWI